MSLKKNIVANYLSQSYVTVVGILAFPLYIKYMGAEAYGLVGFFSILQAWFNLLDLGLSPTVSRETARFRAGLVSPLEYRRLYRSLGCIFLCIALMGATGLLIASPNIATGWLNAEKIPADIVLISVQIMAVSVAIRWVCSFYKGLITGFEGLVWLGGFNSLVATFRFVGVLPVMWYFGFTVMVFFTHQLIVAVFELSVLWVKSRIILPQLKSGVEIGWSWSPVRPLIKFSMTIAFTASIWLMVTQADKLVLSGILSLADYGVFSLAILVASAINVVGGPISSAILPRMTKLEAEQNKREVLRIYRQATQIVAITAGSISLTMAFCSKSLLVAWTGDYSLSISAAPILVLYAVGNGMLAISVFPYYLQYSRGNLRLHLVGHLILLLLLIPAIVVAAINYGAIGAGYVWVVVNLVYLTIWVAVVHSKLEPGLHLSWLTKDFLVIVMPAAAIGYVVHLLELEFNGRIENLLYVFCFGIAVVFFSALMSSYVREKMRAIF
ncbi:MAG: oligosaccharide flippase family protein [Gammaproteobacteria bacterium]|nr:oligosaccharide flippase family protein [Gammaproteobacteria bacterium]MDH5799265.1 oligosaccharide flippase family protein [Gammaproteobacteria bacterium]